METNNKLRETLMSVKKSIDGMGATSLDGDPEIMLMSLTQVCARLSARIEAALAEPVKNCDVGTADVQLKRKRAYCKAQGCRMCPFYGNDSLLCAFRWAQGPYEEEGAK